jgi:DNA-binding NarL/FixJ family response regulator
MMISVIVVEDHLLMRSGLASLFEKQGDCKIVAEYADGREFIQALKSLPKADVVLMDIAMPWLSGLEVLAQIKDRTDLPPVVLLTMFPRRTYAEQALQLGAKGYVTKDSSHEELLEAITAVVAGGTYGLTGYGDAALASSMEMDGAPSLIEGLSSREHEVFRALCAGMTVKETAFALEISVKSVSTYKTRLMEKLGVDSLSELIRIGLTRNL